MPGETEQSPVVTIALRIELAPATLAALTELALAAVMLISPGRAPVISDAVAVPPAPAPVTDRHAEPGRSPAPIIAQNGGGGRVQPAQSWITADRKAALRLLWPTTIPVGEIFDRLNAMDGPPVPNRKVVGVCAAGKLKLARPPGMVPLGLRKAIPKRTSASASATKPDASAPPGETPFVAQPLSSEANANGEASGDTQTSPLAATRGDGDMASQTDAKPKALSPSIAQLARQPLVRKSADKQQIVSFCEARGMRFETFDIDAINKRLAKLGHPGFTLIEAPARRVGRAA